MRTFVIHLEEDEVAALSIHAEVIGLTVDEHLLFVLRALAHSATIGVTLADSDRTEEEIQALMDQYDKLLIERIKAAR